MDERDMADIEICGWAREEEERRRALEEEQGIGDTETDCPIHGRIGGEDGDCPRC